MIRILCYGDSNTWGYISGVGGRYDENIRWPKSLQKLLGSKYEVIEDGLRGRNVGHDFDFYPRGNLNGAKTFPQAVLAHDPIDFVIIMLGTNDLDERFNSNTQECAKILEDRYINYLRHDLFKSIHKMPKIIIVAPNVMNDNASKLKDKGVIDKSKSFNVDYAKLAKKNECIFVSNENLVSGIDGIHLTAESHKILAEKLFKEIIKNT